jgi:hypothetical protein
MSRSFISAFLVLTIAAPLSAQRLQQARVAATREHLALTDDARRRLTDDVRRSVGADAEPPSIALMIVGGTMLGAVGLLGGGTLGYNLENCRGSGDDFCGLGGAILGGLIGESIALPVGVHWAGGRGSLGSEIGAALGITLLGIAAAYATQGPGILLVPPAQLITAIVMEHNAKK